MQVPPEDYFSHAWLQVVIVFQRSGVLEGPDNVPRDRLVAPAQITTPEGMTKFTNTLGGLTSSKYLTHGNRKLISNIKKAHKTGCSFPFLG